MLLPPGLRQWVPEEPERSGDSQPEAARRANLVRQIARREKLASKMARAIEELETSGRAAQARER